MTRCALFVTAALGAVSLTGCLTTTASVPVWEHFDACPEQTAFHDWVTCAKQRRQAACDESRCSASSSQVVAYVDGLDQAVQRHELTEPEARRKWNDYRREREATQEANRRQADHKAADRAAAAAAAPGGCTGRTVGC
jgi:phage/plasmid primase-like uncharacterized protein